MSIISCTKTEDCTGLNNITGEVVLKFCYVKPLFSDISGFCDCDNWLGRTGDNCSKDSSQTEFLLLFSLLFSLGVTFIFAWTTLLTIKILQLRRDFFNASGNKRSFKPNKRVQRLKHELLIGFSFVSSVFFIFIALHSLLSVITPQKASIESIKYVIGDNIEAVQSYNFFLLFGAFTFCMFSTFGSSILLANYFQGLARKVSLSNKKKTSLELYKKFLAVFFISVALLSLILLPLKLFRLNFIFLTGLCYAVGYYVWLCSSEILHTLTSSNTDIRKKKDSVLFLSKLVTQTRNLHLFSIGLLSICVLLMAATHQHSYEGVKPGDVNFISIIFYSGVSFIFVQQVSNLSFVSRYLNNTRLINKFLGVESVDGYNYSEDFQVHQNSRRYSLTSPHAEGSVTIVSLKKNKSVKNINSVVSSHLSEIG